MLIRSKNILYKMVAGSLLFFTLLIACHDDKDLIPVQSENFCLNIHRDDSVTLEQQLRPYDSLMQNKTGAYVLEDGGGSLVTRAWLCEHAEKTIDVQYFIFSTDNVGLIACDYLVRAADRGVKVRILVDDMMVESSIHEILMLNSHKNIDLKIYNPGVNLGKNIFQKIKKIATSFRTANQRMHNKTFIVDGKVAITGGRNIADEYFDYDHEYNFRDRDVLLIGKTVGNIKQSFEQFWNGHLSIPVTDLVSEKENHFEDTNRFERLHEYACNPDNFWPQVQDQIKHLHTTFDSIQHSNGLIWSDSIYFVSDTMGKNNGTHGLSGGGVTTDALINLVQHATHSIDIQSPYLITTEKSLNLFKAAVQRGVHIRILTNSLASTDNLEAFGAYQRVRKKLLEAGVAIYEFKPNAAERTKIATGALQKKLNYVPIFGLHAKSMVVDRHITVIGTFNLDPRSANLNTECFALIYSNTMAERVLQGMEEEYKSENAWHTTLQFNPDTEVGKWKRFKTFTRKALPKSIL